MEFIRSDSGIENRDLFYRPKILVYVEGYSDIPFYQEILQNYICINKTPQEKPSQKKNTKPRHIPTPHVGSAHHI